MIPDRLAHTYIAPRPMQGNRTWSSPMASYRRAPVNPRARAHISPAMIDEAGLAKGGQGGRMPSGLRGLAVLEGLALRAMLRGGRPLMEGRGASLAALTAAIFRN